MYTAWETTLSIAYLNNIQNIHDLLEIINTEFNKLQTGIPNFISSGGNTDILDENHPLHSSVIYQKRGQVIENTLLNLLKSTT